MPSADESGRRGVARIIESLARYNAQQAMYEMPLTLEGA